MHLPRGQSDDGIEWVSFKSSTREGKPQLDVFEYLLEIAGVPSKVVKIVTEGDVQFQLRVREQDLSRAVAAMKGGGTSSADTKLRRATAARLAAEDTKLRAIAATVAAEAEARLRPVMKDFTAWTPNGRYREILSTAWGSSHTLRTMPISAFRSFFLRLLRLSGYILMLPGAIFMIGIVSHTYTKYGLDYFLKVVFWVGLPAGLLFWLGSFMKKYAAERIIVYRRTVAQDIVELVLNDDPETPAFILYLRPFDFDQNLPMANPYHSNNEFQFSYYTEESEMDLESILSEAFWPKLPVIALGRSVNILGAARLSVPDEVWREVVENLARRARFILMLPSDSTSTLWEALLLEKRRHLSKTVFAIPGAEESPEGLLYWLRVQGIFHGAGMTLPDMSKRTTLVSMSDTGRLKAARYLSRGKRSEVRSTIRALIDVKL